MATFQEINDQYEGVHVLIQARMGSTRCPGKVMRKMYDHKPVIQHVVDQCRKSDYPVAVLIPRTPDNQELQDYLFKNHIEHFSGSEKNVLERYFYGARYYKADTIVRITADCPFISPLALRWAVSAYYDLKDKKRVKYVSLDRKNGVPPGFDVEVFGMDVLEKAQAKARTSYDREHVTPWIREHEKCAWPDVPLVFPQESFTIDTEEDFDRIRSMDPPNLKIKTGS